MILTEEQAKKKWCPFAMVPEHNEQSDPSRNRWASGDQLKTANCIASMCMAWRWEMTPNEASSATNAKQIKIQGTGYCGLAGKGND